MIIILVFFAVLLFGVGVLIFLRKAQYDVVHRNFLDLVDRYGGRVVRGGFAVRPRYTGQIEGIQVSVSLSSEKNKESGSRDFYISVYMKKPARTNFTVMSSEWLGSRAGKESPKRIIYSIWESRYQVEVNDKALLKKLNMPRIEEIVRKMHPFAYVLVSQRGIILEKVSLNLAKDTELEQIEPLIEGMRELSEINEESSS